MDLHHNNPSFDEIYQLLIYWLLNEYTIILFITSIFVLSEKTHVALCFSLKVGRSVMACFCLLRVGYDTEVIFVYGTEPVLLYFFFYYLLLWYVTYTLIVTY